MDPASVQAEARNGTVFMVSSGPVLCNWSHRNSAFELTPSITAVFSQAQQGWCWVIKHFCHHWGLSLLFYFLWKTQLPVPYSFSELQKQQHRGTMTHTALKCTYQQDAVPCFTPGSGRNKGLGILGLTSPHYTTWWLG